MIGSPPCCFTRKPAGRFIRKLGKTPHPSAKVETPTPKILGVNQGTFGAIQLKRHLAGKPKFYWAQRVPTGGARLINQDNVMLVVVAIAAIGLPNLAIKSDAFRRSGAS